MKSALVLVVGLWGCAFAEDPVKIALTRGQVSVCCVNNGEWVPGAKDILLVPEDRITTGPHSSAIVQLGSGNDLRIEANSELRLEEWEDNRYQMEIIRGGVAYRVARASNADVQIDTPNVSVKPSQVGAFHLLVNKGESELSVWEANVEVFAPGGSVAVFAGQRLYARGDPWSAQFRIKNPRSLRHMLASIPWMSFQAMADLSLDSTGGGEAKKTAAANKTSNGKPNPAPPRHGQPVPPPRQPHTAPATASHSGGGSSHTASSSGSGSSSSHSASSTTTTSSTSSSSSATSSHK